MNNMQQTDILIIGAGPSGAVAAGLLRKQGRQVLILEQQYFPRFSIGESLLPQSMAYLEEAGFLQDVVEAGFQYKNGAAFAKGDARTAFDFREKFSPGWGTTYQVQRADFDKVLADAAAKAGAEIRYGHAVLAVDVSGAKPCVTARDPEGREYQVQANFLLDASGFGRVLPRLLDLETPSDFPVRGALFTHIEDRIAPQEIDRNKILISVHPQQQDVWFWTIPFSNGRCSQGVVATPEYLARYQGTEVERLRAIIGETPSLSQVLRHAQWDTPGRSISGYAANVKSLWGQGFALLGNAGEFLDPVFSSGVTIAVKSASLAAQCLAQAADGQTVDWQKQYAEPLQAGVNTFRSFVQGWYEGGFQDIIFHEQHNPEIRRMIASILAGYAWDANNPYVAEPQRRLRVLQELCAPQPLAALAEAEAV
jgi:flavin-dependent dehydrogenase